MSYNNMYNNKDISRANMHINEDETLPFIYSCDNRLADISLRCDIKQKINKYLYHERINFDLLKYNIIKDDDIKSYTKLNHLHPSYVGLDCLLLFFKHKEEYISFFVVKKSINKKSKENPNEMIIIPIENFVDTDIYDGTIIDGILIAPDSNIKESNDLLYAQNRTFVISNVFKLKGNDVINIDYQKKMLQAQVSLNTSSYNTTTVCQNSTNAVYKLFNCVNIYVPQIYTYDATNDKSLTDLLLNYKKNILNSCKFYHHINGISFILENK